MADFDEIKKQVAQVEEQQAQKTAALEKTQGRQKRLQHQLDQTQEESEALHDKRDKLQDSLTKQNNTYDELMTDNDELTDSKSKLLEELEDAKAQRNDDFLDWWFNTYPDFDQLSLEQLKQWLQLAAKRYKPASVSGGSGGKQRHLDVQDASEMQEEKLNQSPEQLQEKAERKAELDHNNHEDQDNPKYAAQKLPDKQRIRNNEDENNPIDTKTEVKNQAVFESALGNRDVHEEVDDYLDQHQLPDKKKLQKQYEDDLSL